MSEQWDFTDCLQNTFIVNELKFSQITILLSLLKVSPVQYRHVKQTSSSTILKDLLLFLNFNLTSKDPNKVSSVTSIHNINSLFEMQDENLDKLILKLSIANIMDYAVDKPYIESIHHNIMYLRPTIKYNDILNFLTSISDNSNHQFFKSNLFKKSLLLCIIQF